MEEHAHHKASKKTLDSFLYGGILALVAVLPLFVLPLPGIAPQVGKVFLVEVATLVLFLLWLWRQFRSRKLSVTRSLLSGVLAGFALVVVAASLLSQDFGISFFGEGFTSGEGLFWASLGLLGFLSAQVFNNYKRIVTLYAALVLPFLVVALVQVLRFLFGSGFLRLGVLTTDIATLVGNWNELGLYAGFILLVSLVGIEFLKLKTSYRTLLYVVFGVSLFLVFLTNVSLAWVAVTVGAFLVFLYKTAFRKESEMDHDRRWRLPIMSLIVFVVTLMGAVFLGDIAQTVLSSVRSVQYNEVRLAPGSTWRTIGDAWQQNPATGVGPNQFGYLWHQSRQEAVSRQPLSDVQFGYGFSTVFTLFATLGVLGVLILAVIVGRLVQTGVQVLGTAHANRLQRFFALSVFVLTLYIWLLLFLYVPGTVMLVYAFVMLGTFAGLAADAKQLQPIEIPLRGERNFAIAVVVVFVLAVGIGASLYRVSQKTAGVLAFRRALYATNVQTGYEDALMAARLGGSSAYYRSLASLLGQQIAILGNQSDLTDDEARSQLEFFLGQALTFSLEATQANPYDYLNWVTLGDTYAVLESFDVEGSYVDARTAYERALARNPKANDVLGRLASLELERGNVEEAKTYIETMLARRPTDVQGLVLGARIAYEENDATTGDLYIDAAASASLTEPTTLMQLGVFVFNNERFELAQQIFDFTAVRFPGYKDPAAGLLYALEEQGKLEEARQAAQNLIEAGVLTEEEIGALDLETSLGIGQTSPAASIAPEAEAELVDPVDVGSEEAIVVGSETNQTE